MIDIKDLDKEIRKTVEKSVDLHVSNLVAGIDLSPQIESLIDDIVAEIDLSDYLNKVIETKVNSILNKVDFNQYVSKQTESNIVSSMAKVDIGTMINKHIELFFTNRMKDSGLPKSFVNHESIRWDNYQLSADNISKGIIKDFSSTGIEDKAETVELTIADGVVVVENSFVSQDAEIQNTLISKEIVADTIIVKGDLIISEKTSKQFHSLVTDKITAEIKSRKVDLLTMPDQAIFANDISVLTESKLGPSVIESNLRKLGRLQELYVSGPTEISDTLFVSQTGKVGINTTSPSGALTICDDDAEITVRRHKKRGMFIGSMVDSELSFGIGNDPMLSITKDGTTHVEKFAIGTLLISTSDKVPMGKGVVGEIVIMTTVHENEPWAYRCLGGNKWQALRQ